MVTYYTGKVNRRAYHSDAYQLPTILPLAEQDISGLSAPLLDKGKKGENMVKQKSTSELLEVLKKKTSYSDGQQAIKDEQYSDNLSEYLNSIAAQKDMKLADVMRRSGLKKSYFYSLFDGKRTNPTRDVLIQLGFGFQMSFDEVQEFLRHLGAAQLYPRIPRDGAIIYCFQHGKDIIECDILLSENEEAPLVKV